MKKSLALPLAVSVAVAIAYVITTYTFAEGLPHHVATHFDSQGRPNGGMTREGMIHFNLMAGLGAQAFVTLICYLVRFFPANMLNVPHPDYWRAPENFPKACDHVFRHSLWLGSLLSLWMMLINYEVVQANHTVPMRFEPSSLYLGLGTFAVMLIVWFISLWRSFRLPEEAKKKRKK